MSSGPDISLQLEGVEKVVILDPEQLHGKHFLLMAHPSATADQLQRTVHRFRLVTDDNTMIIVVPAYVEEISALGAEELADRLENAAYSVRNHIKGV